MKKAVLTFFSNLLLISISPNDSLAQQLPGQINVLEGRIQETGLPNGWDTAVDNFNCTVSFQNGSIFFERMSPNEKCSFFFSRQGVPNGEYRLITNFVIDGNNPGMILNGRDLRFESAKAVKDTSIIRAC